MKALKVTTTLDSPHDPHKPEPYDPTYPRCLECGHAFAAHDDGPCAVNAHESATGPECECQGYVNPTHAAELKALEIETLKEQNRKLRRALIDAMHALACATWDPEQIPGGEAGAKLIIDEIRTLTGKEPNT